MIYLVSCFLLSFESHHFILSIIHLDNNNNNNNDDDDDDNNNNDNDDDDDDTLDCFDCALATS